MSGEVSIFALWEATLRPVPHRYVDLSIRTMRLYNSLKFVQHTKKSQKGAKWNVEKSQKGAKWNVEKSQKGAKWNVEKSQKGAKWIVEKSKKGVSLHCEKSKKGEKVLF